MIKEDKKQIRRWYDKNTIVTRAIELLRTSDDELVKKVTIELLGIVNKQEPNSIFIRSDLIIDEEIKKLPSQTRWYDLNKQVQRTVESLKYCNPEMQEKLATQIITMLESEEIIKKESVITICSKCNTENDANSNFCGGCGKNLSVSNSTNFCNKRDIKNNLNNEKSGIDDIKSQLIVAKGFNGNLELYEDKLIINRNDVSKIKLQGIKDFKGNKEFLLTQISYMQFKNASTLQQGYIQICSNKDSQLTKGVLSASLNNNTVLFLKNQENPFLKIKNKIEKLPILNNKTDSKNNIQHTYFHSESSEKNTKTTIDKTYASISHCYECGFENNLNDQFCKKCGIKDYTKSALILAKGVNGAIELYKDRLIITRKGFLSFMLQGIKGDKEILLKYITSIQLKKTDITNGFIQIGFMGGAESKKGIFDATRDENTVMFNPNQEHVFLKLKESIEKCMSLLESSSKSKPSKLDELEKLASLKEKGIITEEEFNIQKKQILDI